MAASSNPSSDTLSYGTLIHMLTIKLSSTNYLLWRSQIYPLLIGQGLISLVDGSRPAPPTDVVADGNSTPNPAYQSWRVDDQRLVSLIFSSLSEEAMPVVSIKKGSRSVSEFGRDFKLVCDQLSAIGQSVDETDKIHVFMKGLGSDFSSFSATHMAMSLLPSFSDLLNNAEAWDMFQQTLEPNMSSPAAFTTHTYSQSSNNQMSGGRGSGPKKSGRGGFSQKRQPHSQICRTTGHYANVCPDRFNREIATTTPVANIVEAFSASNIASDPPISDSRRDVLYVFDDTKSALVAARTPKASFELWHSRLGHLPNVNPDPAPQPSSCNLCDEPPLLSGLQSHTNQDEPTINTHELPAIPHETQSHPNQEEPDINDQHVNESSLDPIIEPAPQIEMNPPAPPPIEMNPIVPLPRVSSTHPMQTRSRAALKRPEWVDALKQELSAMALKDSWDLIPRPKYLDVQNAFLNDVLSKPVYMEQPPGFIDPQFPNHAKYARDIIQRASLEESKPVSTPLVADNNSAIFLSQNPSSHKRAKHIDIDFHFVRELVSNEMSYALDIIRRLA
ncbi:hypothetical protein SASPL_153027 [Salvia splendens]|uniref:Retrotransposon Copia-like N-terminal domain-containing protein n=1 Tax=Salvia splendens TaxID=180675 RepID=A0A8X8W490_SALSN|nr:hypothetical protein SASPL_153027 [Salvia splendens]